MKQNVTSYIVYSVAAITAFSAVGALLGAIGGVILTLLAIEILGSGNPMLLLTACTAISTIVAFGWIVRVVYSHRPHPARATVTE